MDEKRMRDEVAGRVFGYPPVDLAGEDPLDDPETRADYLIGEAIKNVLGVILADEERDLHDIRRFGLLARAHTALCAIKGYEGDAPS